MVFRPRWCPVLPAPRVGGREGSGGDDGLLSGAGVLGQHAVEHLGNELLLGPGQARDRVELLFEARDRAVPCAARCSGGNLYGFVVGDQRLNGDAQHFGKARGQGDGHPALGEFVEGELGLRDAQRFGELHLRQIGGGTGLGDARGNSSGLFRDS